MCLYSKARPKKVKKKGLRINMREETEENEKLVAKADNTANVTHEVTKKEEIILRKAQPKMCKESG